MATVLDQLRPGVAVTVTAFGGTRPGRQHHIQDLGALSATIVSP